MPSVPTTDDQVRLCFTYGVQHSNIRSMLFPTLIRTFIVALLAAHVNAAALSNRQTTESTLGSFYAYGEGLDGLPVFWSDETAFIGLEPPQDSTVATNVTCKHPNSFCTMRRLTDCQSTTIRTTQL